MVAATATAAGAQGPGWGLGALATLSERSSGVGGLAQVVVRPYDRIRFAGSVGALTDLGPRDGGIGRVEALAQFHVSPYQRTGWGLYLGAGLAYVVQQYESGAVRLLVTLGAEHAPGGSRSLYVEAGLAGGWRVGLGLRWRPRLGR